MKPNPHALKLLCAAAIAVFPAAGGAAGPAEGDRKAGVRPGFLGVAICDVAPEVRAQTNLAEGEGLLVRLVSPDSPAARAGIRPFDILLRFDGQELVSKVQFVSLVEQAGADKPILLAVLRRGDEIELPVVLADRPPAVAGGGEFVAESAADKLAAVDRVLRDNPSALEAIHRMLVAPAVPDTGGTLQVQTEECEDLRLDDEFGRVEISTKSGARTVRITDPDGAELYSGALATPADLLAVPEAFRPRVEKLERNLSEWLRAREREKAKSDR